jgi:phage gp36-like protein
MAYHTLEDLKNTVPEEIIIALSDDSMVGVVNETVVAALIASTDSLIDSYVSAQNSIPLTPCPAEIRDIACDITIYKLYKRRQEELSDTRRLAYKDAIRLLEQIRDGKHELNVSIAANNSYSSGVVISDHYTFGDSNA